MTHTTGLPMITVGTPNWGVAVNDAFTEANRRLTLNGLLSPHPRERTDTEDAYVGETPNWVGQVYIQTTPYTIWISVGLLPTDWKQFQEFVDFSEDRLVGAENPNHMVTIVEDADDIVTNEGLVPDYVGQRYLQSVGNVIWFAEGTTNTSWKRLSEFLVGWTEITTAGTHNLLNVLELEVYLQGAASMTGRELGYPADGEESTISIDGVSFVVPGSNRYNAPYTSAGAGWIQGVPQGTQTAVVQTGASIDVVQIPIDLINNQLMAGSAFLTFPSSSSTRNGQYTGSTGPVLYFRTIKTLPTDLELIISLGAGGSITTLTTGRTVTASTIVEAGAAEVRVRYR